MTTKRFRNIFLILIGLFVLLFLFRLGYGYTLDVDTEEKESVYFDGFYDTKFNYASQKNEIISGKGAYNKKTITYDQKYEKIAEVTSETHSFRKDEKLVRKRIKASEGIIQFEKKSGNKGHRRVQFQVGVPPNNFDPLYTQLIKIGIIHSKEIIKNDKTNDYRELKAKKISLEKTLASLIEFKEKSGQIQEFINLENRILEIEEKLQTLGVNLGDYDESNEFCTIKFSLTEGKPAVITTVSFYHRCKVALEWTIKRYLTLISALFFLTLATYLLTLLFEKGDFFKTSYKRLKDKFSKS